MAEKNTCLYSGTTDVVYTQKVLVKALERTKEKNPGWDLSDVSPEEHGTNWLLRAPITHHMKAKVREIYASADTIVNENAGLKEFIVTVAVDGRVGIKILAADLEAAVEKARDMARYGSFDYELSQIAVVDDHPVNISDADGNVLLDF